jgi:hypothetical protein
VPLYVDVFDKVIDESEIEVTLTDLVQELYDQECYGGGNWHEIPDDTWGDNTVAFIKGYDHYEIRNIIEEIDVDPIRSRFYVLINTIYRDYQWAVAVHQHTVYAG